MSARRLLIACLVTSLVGPIAAAQNAPADKPAGKAEAKQAPNREPNSGDPVTDDFIRGFDGDNDAMDRAIRSARQRLEENPDNGSMLTWLGAAQGYRAGQAFQRGETADGIGLWMASNRNMNRGVELEPDNTTVRMVRGKSMLESSVHDPNPATSKAALETAMGDFEHIVDLHGDQIREFLSDGTRARVYGWLSQAYSRAGRAADAEKYHKMAKELGFKEPSKKPDVRQPPEANPALESALAILTDEPATLVGDDLRAGLKDPARIEAVIAMMDARLNAKPEDAPALAWRGFARTMSSGKHYAKGEMEKGAKVWLAGAEEIDKAVVMDAASLHPRVLRGLTQLEVARLEMDPDKAREAAERAAADFDRAVRTLPDAAEAPLGKEGQPAPSKPAPAARARMELLLLSGESLSRAGRRPAAESTMTRLMSMSPDDKIKARAQKVLDRMRKPADVP